MKVTVLPVAAPTRVRDLLRDAPDGPHRVLHRGPRAVYVEVGGRAVGILAVGAVAVPCGVQTTIREFSPCDAESPYSEGGVLHIDGRPLSVRRIVGVHIPRLRQVEAPRNTANSTTRAATPPAAVVGFVGIFAPAGLDADAVAVLIGRGEGLTPLGDDVVCGWLAASRAVGRETPAVDAAVRAHAHRTTLLSATLLDCALHGEAIPQLSAWLHARHDDPAPGEALLAVGGTSGAGLMAGALLAFDALRRTPDGAA